MMDTEVTSLGCLLIIQYIQSADIVSKTARKAVPGVLLLKAVWRGTIRLSQLSWARQRPPCLCRSPAICRQKALFICPHGWFLQVPFLVCFITKQTFLIQSFLYQLPDCIKFSFIHILMHSNKLWKTDNLNNRKRTIKMAHSTYKLKVIFTQGEKVVKDMYKGRTKIHNNVTHLPPCLHSQSFPNSSPFSPSGPNQLNFPCHPILKYYLQTPQFPSRVDASPFECSPE